MTSGMSLSPWGPGCMSGIWRTNEAGCVALRAKRLTFLLTSVCSSILLEFIRGPEWSPSVRSLLQSCSVTDKVFTVSAGRSFKFKILSSVLLSLKFCFLRASGSESNLAFAMPQAHLSHKHINLQGCEAVNMISVDSSIQCSRGTEDM